MRNPLSRLFSALRLNKAREETPRSPAEQLAADEALVRLLIPRAWFTRRGPGVTDRTRRAFYAFTDSQKRVAIDRGWIPAFWWGDNQDRVDAITRSLPRKRKSA